MYMCIFHYFNYHLSDFMTAICLGFISGFSFLDISFNLTSCHNQPLMESSFINRDQAQSLWSGSTESKTLHYQRTNPREYQSENSDKGKHLNKTRHHPTTSNTLCRRPHLNNKQNKYTNPIISRQDYHLTQPCPSEEKQTKTHHKSHPIGSLHKSLDNFYSTVQFRGSVMPETLRPHVLQHARPPCPSPTPEVYSNSCPLSW